RSRDWVRAFRGARAAARSNCAPSGEQLFSHLLDPRLERACLLERVVDLRGRRRALAPALAKDLPRAGQRVALVVQQRPNLQEARQVLLAVHPLAGARPVRLHAELALPVAEHVCVDPDELRDLTDPEVELVRDLVVEVAHGFSSSLSFREYSKRTTRRRGITMSSPVWGLRPRRACLSLTTKFPKPEIFTLSP